MSYQIETTTAVLIGVLAVWEMIWKGMALWRSAQSKQAAWFVAILIINTVGVLPIFYLLTHRDKTSRA